MSVPLFTLMLVILVSGGGDRQKIARIPIATGLSWERCKAMESDYESRVSSPIVLGSKDIRNIVGCVYRP